jgi:hypothetical protein
VADGYGLPHLKVLLIQKADVIVGITNRLLLRDATRTRSVCPQGFRCQERQEQEGKVFLHNLGMLSTRGDVIN